MFKNLRYKSLIQVPSIYKCFTCQQIPKEPVFEFGRNYLTCLGCLHEIYQVSDRHYVYISLTELQIQVINSISIKCEYCGQQIQGNKLQKHIFKCQSTKTEEQIFIEQQLLKFNQIFECKQCRQITFAIFSCTLCRTRYCQRCACEIKCCGQAMKPNQSEDFNQIYQQQISCINCEKQFMTIELHQHASECLGMWIKCQCGTLMRRRQYCLHFQSCNNKQMETRVQNQLKMEMADKFMEFQSFNNALAISQYECELYFLGCAEEESFTTPQEEQ